MGPDEYNWPVNNSAYSNAIASVALEFAAEAAAEEPAAAGSAAVGKQVDNSAAPPGLLFRSFYRVNPNGTLDCVKNLSLECNRQRS